jgi:hypothetical protein
VNWRYLLESWNPNKYTILRELSLARLCYLIAVGAVFSVAVFLLLLVPAVLSADTAFDELAEKTDISINASFAQTEPVYLVENPDIVVTSGAEQGFITITPQGFSVKYFIFFGERNYPWIGFSNLDTLPIDNMLFSLALFTLPSALVWGTFLILVNLVVFGFLYTLIAYFILHAREYNVVYTDLWKVTLFAGIPSMSLLAVTPILRLGLPLAVIIGFMFVVWLVFSLLGSALFAHQNPGHSSVKKH